MYAEVRDRMIAQLSKIYRDDRQYLFDVATEFHGGVHGDILWPNGVREVDIEFPTVADAVAFSQSIHKYVTNVDVRTGDSVSSLCQSVVLTVTITVLTIGT